MISLGPAGFVRSDDRWILTSDLATRLDKLIIFGTLKYDWLHFSPGSTFFFVYFKFGFGVMDFKTPNACFFLENKTNAFTIHIN